MKSARQNIRKASCIIFAANVIIAVIIGLKESFPDGLMAFGLGLALIGFGMSVNEWLADSNDNS